MSRKTIQIANIPVGAVKTDLEGDAISPLKYLPFDIRKIGGQKGKIVKAYYWIR